MAATQAEVVAAWQLRQAGWSATKIRHHAARGAWRRVHPGVYVLTRAQPSQVQLWWAAALTTPTSFLSHGSAAACYGFHRFSKPFEVVTRPGQGGRRRLGRLLVFRSKRLQGETTRHTGIPITTAERTLVDVAAGLDAKRVGRCFREAIRLKTTTAARVARCVERHGDAPTLLAAVARRYAKLPYRRTRSDAEARALELLDDAGIRPPGVNVRIGGEEADLVWVERRLIVEIDGPQFHLFRDEDARKEAIWRDAGFTVRRVPSSTVYDDPAAFVACCVRP
ncbi:MAG TPA: DUF559 domain-containing protein [Thermoleophilaceae bacterium]